MDNVLNFANLKEGRVQKLFTANRLSMSSFTQITLDSTFYHLFLLSSLNSNDTWHIIFMWSMSHAGCGYEYMTMLLKAVTCKGGSSGEGGKTYVCMGGVPYYPPTSLSYVIANLRVRTLTLMSDDSWSSDFRVIDISWSSDLRVIYVSWTVWLGVHGNI